MSFRQGSQAVSVLNCYGCCHKVASASILLHRVAWAVIHTATFERMTLQTESDAQGFTCCPWTSHVRSALRSDKHMLNGCMAEELRNSTFKIE